MLLTSHIMSDVDELADDIIYLVDGRVQYDGALPDLKDEMGQSSLERAIAAMMSRRVAA